MMNAQKSRLKTVLIYVILVAIACVTLFPLFWLVSTSLKSQTEGISQSALEFIPSHPTLENFMNVWTEEPLFGQYLANSVLVSIFTVGLNLLFCSLAAYPLARLSFPGRDWIFISIISTIMIPFQIVMIPLYILTVKLGLTNNYLGIIFPNLASAFGIFLLRQAFMGVPKEIEEAARMDGSSELGLWWHIMLPSIRPALITLAIFVFIGAWSDFLWPLIVNQEQALYTLPVGVSKLANNSSLNWRLVAAGSVISIAPVLILFLFLQKFIVPTDSGSGVKG